MIDGELAYVNWAGADPPSAGPLSGRRVLNPDDLDRTVLGIPDLETVLPQQRPDAVGLSVVAPPSLGHPHLGPPPRPELGRLRIRRGHLGRRGQHPILRRHPVGRAGP